MKTVLIVGSGGREHALAFKIAQSPLVERVYVAPGNAGTSTEHKCQNVAIQADAISELVLFAQQHNVDLTVIGPDDPLAQGIVDAFAQAHLVVFGPTKAAARLEWSKVFTKDFLARHNIPTAQYKTFDTYADAEAYIVQQGTPIVVKADGLAAGKGVVVAHTVSEACDFARECLEGNKFGASGARVVVEEFMDGEEASFTAIVSGTTIVPLATSQDHKRINNNDEGPNTGGMGTYSPAPVVTDAVYKRVMHDIIEPTVRGMVAEGAPFTGFLYCGLMIKDGMPKVVEYNARFGDPETQPILMRLHSDIVPVLYAAATGSLAEMPPLKWKDDAAVCVIMASEGYPGNYKKGVPITGIADAEMSEHTKVFHAGTKFENGTLVTNGGRVLGVTALGNTIAHAQQRAYEAVGKIHWDGEHHRTDIAWRALRQR